MRNPEEFWSTVFLSIIATAVMTLVIIIAIALTANHTVRQYYLTSYNSTGVTIPNIVVDIDWQTDESILLDKNTTFPEAIQLVDSLNATLKR